jgi:hypothetical protein
MGVRFLEHILILTDDPAGTRDWWCQTLKVKLDFAAEEARRAGRKPTRTAADAAREQPAATG